MQIGKVIGNAVSTVKHPSLTGSKLLLVQPLHGEAPDGDPVIAIDAAGAGADELVLITSDGASARNLVKDRKSPVRWSVIGIVDGA